MELENDHFKNLATKKHIALKNAEFIRRMSCDNDFKFMSWALAKRSERIKNCFNYWEWARYDKNKVLDLKKVVRCKDLYCPNCRRTNNQKYILINMPIFLDLLGQMYHPYMMTITVPNCEAFELKDTIEEMIKSFKWFFKQLSSDDKSYRLKDRLFDIVGAIRVLEVTYNFKQNTYHPHFHVFCFIDSDQEFDFRKYIPGGWQIKTEKYIYYSDADIFIQELWTKCFYSLEKNKLKEIDDHELLKCDIRPLLMPYGFNEVFKYVFKDSNIRNYESFKTIFDALASKKLRQAYGLLYNAGGPGIPFEDDEGSDIKDFLEFEEEFEIERINNIADIVNRFPDYKKLSRYRKDNEKYKAAVKDF